MSSTSSLFGLFSSNNDAEVMANSQNFAVQQMTTQVGIMGMANMFAAQQQANTLMFQISAQKDVAFAQMRYADLADRRVAANERRAMRNETLAMQLNYSAQIHQENLYFRLEKQKIGNEAKYIDYLQMVARLDAQKPKVVSTGELGITTGSA